MTKRHFIALADYLRPTYKNGDISENALKAIMYFCKSQNPAFLEQRWLSYLKGECGPGGGAIKKPKAVKSFGRSEFKVFKAVENA